MQKEKLVYPIWRVKEKDSNRWVEFSTIDRLNEFLQETGELYDKDTVSQRMTVAYRQGKDIQEIYIGDILLFIPKYSDKFWFATVEAGNVFGMGLRTNPVNSIWLDYEEIDRKWDYFVIGNKWTTPELFCRIMTK